MTANTFHGQTARLIASVATCLPPLSAEEMQSWIDNPRGLKKFLSGLQPPQTEAKLLDLVTTVKMSERGRFVARESIQENTGTKAEVKIAWLGDNLKTYFLDLVEKERGAIELRFHKLRGASLDAPIIAELGEVAEITLGQFWSLLRQQARGQSGPLLTNGWANIAYIRDVNEELRAVGAYWNADYGGWDVEANSVTNLHGWHAGRRVVSR